MSNHHSRKSILLHHKQVAAARDRRASSQAERVETYLTNWKQHQFEQRIVNVGAGFCFVYSMFAIALYTGYIL